MTANPAKERGARIRAAIGRPAERQTKTEVHSFRLTPSEADLVEEACIQAQTTLSEFIHKAVTDLVYQILKEK